MEIYLIGFIAALLIAWVSTPFVRKLAILVGAVDAPNHRKVHTRIMPRLGGLAIYVGFVLSYFIIAPATDVALGLLIGGSIVVLVGALDDKYQISPKAKLAGQLVAASVVVSLGIRVDFFYLPFDDAAVILGWLSIPITVLWIVGVTNAINLLDGLDGLASGVSAIATATMMVMALLMGNYAVALLCCVLLGSTLGFLWFNFHPAKIFMGDSGSLFLGFSLATLSILGFKQVTIVSFIIPLLILGVPLSDTFYAIVRRLVNKTGISVADKGHLHHCLLNMGLGHRKTVLTIYAIAMSFGAAAILLSQTTLWGSMLLLVAILFAIEIGAEAIGIFGKAYKPLLQLLGVKKETPPPVQGRAVQPK
jgi:UDP-GlcNAc:undecaprenyl-phosphate GlcNAc-1-phosphate transferase